MEWTKGARLREFVGRLIAAPSAGSFIEARALIEDTLNSVEDEFSGTPYNPDAANGVATDNRMYPPHDNFRRSVPGRPEVTRFRAKEHNTFIRDNGAIEIQLAETKAVVFQKVGKDGRGVWEP